MTVKSWKIGEPFQVEGLRLYLRNLTLGDATQNYVQWMNDPLVTRFLESRFRSYTIEDIRSYIDHTLQDGTSVLAGIFIKATHQHIGNIKLGPINHHHRFAEMGLILGERSCWGKGYASEAIKVFSDFGFETLGLNRIVAGAYLENQGSIKAFLKSGFVQEGILKNHWLCDGKFQDGIILGKEAPR